MKKTLLFVSMFVAGASFAQNTFTNANETANGTYTYFVCDSFADTKAGVVGSGVTWDYSDLAKINNSTKSIVVDNNTDVTNFPDATKTVEIDALMADFLKTTATERTRYGITLQEATFGTVVAKFSSNPATTMNYPFALNTTVVDSFAGTLDAGGLLSNNPMTGNHKTTYDGYGTFKIGNQTISNVSRVRYNDTITTPVALLGANINVYLEQFEYYDLNGTDFEPIFIALKTTIVQEGSSTPMMENSLVLSKYEPTEIYSGVGLDQLANINFKLAPNPVKDQLFVSGDFDNASIQIIDQAGKIVFNGNASNGTVISTANLDAGIYVVKATVNGQTATNKIVKL